MSVPATYSGWQSERSGFIGSLSGPGFCLVASSALLMALPFYRQSLTPAFLTYPLAGVLLLLALGRVQGLTADEWIVLAVRFQIAKATSRTTFSSGIFSPRTRFGEQPLDLPGILARLRILDAPDASGGRLGVVHDPITNTYTAILKVDHPGLALVDTDRQDARVAAWGALLKSQCIEGGNVVRISVHQRSLPDDGTALLSWTAAHQAPDAPRQAIAALGELMDFAGPAATARETYLSITLSAARARFAIKSAGGGQVGACAVLVREIGAMQGALASAGLIIGEMLNPRGVGAVVLSAYDPHAHPMLAARSAAASDAGWKGTSRGADPDLAGPSAAVNRWAAYQHDGAFTVTFQVRKWPQGHVHATFLQPLLRPCTNARRSMTLLHEPIGPARARSELSRERTRREAARKLRAKTGKAESLDERHEAATAHAQDAARVAGHGLTRFTALLAVTVTDVEELDTACAELQADASAAALELRRMWGAQDVGFATAALPLGVGLPDRRGWI